MPVRQFVLYHDNDLENKFVKNLLSLESFAICIDSEEVSIGDGVYTSTTFSYSAQETFSPMDPNGHKHILVWQ